MHLDATDVTAIIVKRAALSNQERADLPLAREQAWAIARERTDDHRNAALHQLVSDAVKQGDDGLWSEIGAFLQDVAGNQVSYLVLKRFGDACPLRNMAGWARARARDRLAVPEASDPIAA